MNGMHPRAGDGYFLNRVVESDREPRNGLGWAEIHYSRYDGAEQRPFPIAPPLPASKPRPSWPPYLALAAIVLALDHGNVGAAALVAIWWFGWAVRV